MGFKMAELLKTGRKHKPADFIFIDHQDYVEDKLISLCDELDETGIDKIKIASGLLFALHDLLCKLDSPQAQEHYNLLLAQCHDHISAMQEYYAEIERDKSKAD